MNKETRNLSQGLTVNERTVSGYAIVYDSDSNDLGFIETINPRALDGVLEKSDIIAVFNHNHSQVPFARYSKTHDTLKLSSDEKGLRYEYEMPNTPDGNELLEAIKRGDIDSNSFVFTIAEDGDRWYRDGNITRREVTQFDRLFDVSLVTHPAYDAAMVDKRGLDELEQKESRAQNYRDFCAKVNKFKEKDNE